MFLHVEAFFRNYRLTGNPMHMQPTSPGMNNNIIRGTTPSSNTSQNLRGTEPGLLEEIEEAEEEMELKRGKCKIR